MNVTIVGRIGGDPEIKFTQSGTAMLTISVAENHRRFNKDTQQWEDVRTDWHRVTMFGPKAEALVDELRKGQRVIVVGDLESRQFETREGEKRTAWGVKASEVGVIPSANMSSATQGGGSQQVRADDPWASDLPPF